MLHKVIDMEDAGRRHCLVMGAGDLTNSLMES